jgi:hypothetical protein
MKRALLLIVLPALLVALGFAQTPAASTNPDQTIKGCLAGSDGNYTVSGSLPAVSISISMWDMT